MRFPFIGAVALCWAIVGSSALARSPQEMQYLGETTGTEISESRSRPHALPPSQWPEELRDALKAFEIEAGRTGCTRRNALAVLRNGAFNVLASTWRCQSGQLFTLHRLKNGKLDLVRRLQESYVTLVEPSGMDAFPDHAPALFVDVGSGGSGYEGYGQHVFRVEANGVKEVTPALRTPWVDMVDGSLVAVSSDDRWGNFFRTCGQCGPHLPVLQEWRDGAFRAACKSHPALIEQRIALEDEVAAKAESEGNELGAIESRLEKALLLLQMGRGGEGRAEYESILARLERSHDPKIRANWLKAVQDAFTDVVAQAADPTDAQCPLTDAKGPGGHPGAKARADHFRFSDKP